ncbi:MAG: DUF935 family protein [Bacteroidetes bacterium]|nr:DUF935 family protein [Bacteroidota bacterium]
MQQTINDYYRKTQEEGKQQSTIDNWLSARNKTKEQVQSIIFDLVEQTKALTQQEIGKWRLAWQQAISVEWPNRIPLYSIYRDVSVDNHLIGVIGQIKKEVLQKTPKVYDFTSKNKDELPELTEQLIDTSWFIDFCGLVIDSEFTGYELAVFGDIINVNGYKKFKSVEALEREHVIPEHHVFVKNMGEPAISGIDYTQPPYNDWCIGIGKPKNLGLYNAVARHAISKKNMEGFWDKFGQIFGMPIRIGKTNSSNPKDRNEIAEMLQKMGAAAWGMFPDGTNIDIKETSRGDAYAVYDKRIERANSEISKAIVHQTMTTDNGSSKSQSETHLKIQGFVVEYFAQLVRIYCNDYLIPLMVKHGFTGWEKARIKHDNTIELTPEQQQKVEEMLLNNFNVDGNFFEKKYNIKILGNKQQNDTNSFFDQAPTK